jgi:site-specific DNA-methyltransferase (adenine-specific)
MFAGSGSECLASKQLGLPFIGIELNEEYVKLIQERLKVSNSDELFYTSNIIQ